MRLDHLLSREKKRLPSREEKTEEDGRPVGRSETARLRVTALGRPLCPSQRPAPGAQTRAHPESRIAREIAERMTLHLFSSSDRIIHSDMYVYLCSFYPDV